MDEGIVVLHKEVGETPLECLNRYRARCVAEHPGERERYENLKMTYAGRLDPMAEGVLVALTGASVHEKESFLRLPKTYVCTAILGIETDTYDILGVPTSGAQVPGDDAVRDALLRFVGSFDQEYPPYSSKTLNGRQLHALARTGKLAGAKLPSHRVTVSSISEVTIAPATLGELLPDIVSRVRKVRGDFRQDEIVAAWKGLPGDFPVRTVTFTVSVSGGTYIRGIVHELGKRLRTGACVWKLDRTSVGYLTF